MKIKRHSKIIELVKNYNIETQDELSEKLRLLGYEVTQATISRDIRELKLTKVSDSNGNQKYSVLPSVDNEFSDRFIRVFQDGVTNIDFAQNMIIIKTFEGMAMAVAACIDAMNYAEYIGCEIMGTIAGDDTLFCVVKTEEQAISVINKLKEIMRSN